ALDGGRGGWRRAGARHRRAAPARGSRGVGTMSLQVREAEISTRQGFTLLEVMVVMFILGLLATLVAPRILGRADDARRTKAIADMKGIEQALNLYRLDSGGYPTTEQGLDALA